MYISFLQTFGRGKISALRSISGRRARTNINMKVSVMFHGEWVYFTGHRLAQLHHLRGVNPRNRILYFTPVSPGKPGEKRLTSASCFRIRGVVSRDPRNPLFPRFVPLFMETTRMKKNKVTRPVETVSSPASFRRPTCAAVQLINYLALQSTAGGRMKVSSRLPSSRGIH